MIQLGDLLKAAIEGNDSGKAVLEISPQNKTFQIIYSNQVFKSLSQKFDLNKFLKSRVQNLNFNTETIFTESYEVIASKFVHFHFPEGDKTSEYYNLYISDITTKYRQEEEIAWRMRFELGVSSSLQILLQKPTLASALPQALYQLLYFTEMDSVFYLKYTTKEGRASYQIFANEKKSVKFKSIPKVIETNWENLGILRWHHKIKRGKVLFLNKEKVLPRESWYFEGGIEDVLLIPLNSQNKFLGILGFERQHKANKIKKENILVYQSIASWLAIFLEREEAIEELGKYKSSLESLVVEKTLDLEKAKLELQKAYEAKASFLTHMSHELRTPLNSILGFSRLIQLPEGDETGKEYLGYIANAGQRLLTMINDILGLMKVESGEMKLYLVEMDPIEIFENSKRLIFPLTSAKGKEVQACVYGTPYSIQSDPGKIQQILINLLSNAVKYGGAFPIIEFNLYFEENQVAFYVADKGSGISEEDQKTIFQNFSRLSEDGNIEGTGLGLSISQKLAELLGGKIELQSTPGLGSKFALIIPREKNKGIELY